MKLTVVDESLSSTNNYSSVPEKINLLQTVIMYKKYMYGMWSYRINLQYLQWSYRFTNMIICSMGDFSKYICSVWSYNMIMIIIIVYLQECGTINLYRYK